MEYQQTFASIDIDLVFDDAVTDWGESLVDVEIWRKHIGEPELTLTEVYHRIMHVGANAVNSDDGYAYRVVVTLSGATYSLVYSSLDVVDIP